MEALGEGALQGREGDVDDRQIERGHECPEGRDREDPPGEAGTGVGWRTGLRVGRGPGKLLVIRSPKLSPDQVPRSGVAIHSLPCLRSRDRDPVGSTGAFARRTVDASHARVRMASGFPAARRSAGRSLTGRPRRKWSACRRSSARCASPRANEMYGPVMRPARHPRGAASGRPRSGRPSNPPCGPAPPSPGQIDPAPTVGA